MRLYAARVYGIEPDAATAQGAAGFDALYYGRACFDNTAGSVTTAKLVSAHIDMEVYVEGFSDPMDPIRTCCGVRGYGLRLLDGTIAAGSGRVRPEGEYFDNGRLYGYRFQPAAVHRGERHYPLALRLRRKLLTRFGLAGLYGYPQYPESQAYRRPSCVCLSGSPQPCGDNRSRLGQTAI